MIKKSANYKNWTIEFLDTKQIVVKQDGVVCEKSKPVLRQIAEDLNYEIDETWITNYLGHALIEFIDMRTSNTLKIDGRMKVNQLKRNFKGLFHATLRVKIGNRLADEDATLSSIRTSGAQIAGDFVFPANMTVGTFQESLFNIYGLQVVVATVDNWVAALEDLTLEEVGKIKKSAVKADMQKILDERLAREEAIRIEREGIVTVSGNKFLKTLQTEFSNKFQYLALCFIRTSDRNKSAGVYGLETTKTISDVRTKTTDKELSINGNNHVSDIENYFWDELGIACQVGICNYGGHPYYFPLGSFNDKTLSEANRWAKDAGCKQLDSTNIAGLNKGYIF